MALALRHYYSYSGRTEKPHKKSSTFKQEQFAENQPQISSKMVAAMSFTTVNNVMDSWEDVRRIENYDEVVGVALFEKYVRFYILSCRTLVLLRQTHYYVVILFTDYSRSIRLL
jgi:hypothetical protein